MEFNVGDVVKLRSGGPRMTVKHPTNVSVKAQWFDESRLQEGLFSPDSLELVTRVPDGD